MLVNHLFELNGEYVFVEVDNEMSIKEAREYLLDHLDYVPEEMPVYIETYTVEEAEMLGYDTF